MKTQYIVYYEIEGIEAKMKAEVEYEKLDITVRALRTKNIKVKAIYVKFVENED